MGSGPQLIWGPNAAGKTSLLEAIAVLAWGRSHRTSTDAEMIRWGQPFARVEGHLTEPREMTLEVALVAAGMTGRKRIQVNGVPRRTSGLLTRVRRQGLEPSCPRATRVSPYRSAPTSNRSLSAPDSLTYAA